MLVAWEECSRLQGGEAAWQSVHRQMLALINPAWDLQENRHLIVNHDRHHAVVIAVLRTIMVGAWTLVVPYTRTYAKRVCGAGNSAQS